MATTESPKPPPSFPEMGPTLESDDYIVYHGENTLAIYSSRNQGVSLDDKLNFTEKTLMIYAETVFLNSKVISIEGKNLGIFCNKLVLSLDGACIDVSGAKDANGTPTSNKGENGGNGGTIWLYVEEPTPNLRKNLRIKAYGRDGGQGVEDKPQGGDGGDGGLCGVIKCYIGSAVGRYAECLHSVATSQKSNWPGWIRDISPSIYDDMDALVSSGFNEGTANSWKSTVASAAGLLDAGEKLQIALSRLISDDPDRATPNQETFDAIQRLLASLGKMFKDENGLVLPSEQDVASLVQLTKNCDSFYGGSAAEKKLQGGLEDALNTVVALTPTTPGVSPLLNGLYHFSATLYSFIDNEARGFIDQIALLGGGKGGPGGSGPTPEIPSGKRGIDQPDNIADAQLVSLSGNKNDRSIDQAIVSPEQCQMILDAAGKG
ncbi:serine protein kinase [Fusarium bulbicola]|nr:serine protein kinase [Fusarium bulbicola]